MTPTEEMEKVRTQGVDTVDTIRLALEDGTGKPATTKEALALRNKLCLQMANRSNMPLSKMSGHTYKLLTEGYLIAVYSKRDRDYRFSARGSPTDNTIYDQ